MHLIQDCNAGFSTDAMTTSFTHSSLIKVQTARTRQWLAGYKGVDYNTMMLENEAFHYEVLPSKIITKLLKERC